MADLFTRLTLGLLWLLSWLPLKVIGHLGDAFGSLLFLAVRPRRKVVLINLRLCFPELSDGERKNLAKRHFQALARSILERGILWWQPEARIRSLVRMEGREHLEALLAAGRPVIMLCPHFLALDWAGARIAMDFEAASIYSHQKNALLDKMLLHGRSRFIKPVLLSRQDGMRGIVKVLKKGLPLYYLPDMDFGPQDAIFSPFFGVSAATIAGLPRLARLTNAVVLPTIARADEDGKGFSVTFDAPWPDYPGGDLQADVDRMNAYIESVVRSMPEQYYWVHKRFKTRPPGETSFYDAG